MLSYVFMSKKQSEELPRIFHEDGRFDEGLLEYLILNFTNEGDFILDPFAGYGTVFKVSEKLNRQYGGIEINKSRFTYIKEMVKNHKYLFNEDLFQFDSSKMPLADIIITSAPYAWCNLGHNPFTGYSGSDYYNQYLKMIRLSFIKMAQMIKPRGLILFDTCNVEYNGLFTSLAWDVKRSTEMIDELSFRKEIVICWTSSTEGFLGGQYGFGQDHSYCLVYQRELE